MRLFFAVMLPEAVVEAAQLLQRDLAERVADPGVRWTKPHQLHFTVRFLGEQTPERAGRAVDAACEACAVQRPFELAVGGLGAFPSAARPSVLWVGATEGAAELSALATRLEDALVAQGFARERRALTPHITLARIKTWTGEAAVARTLKKAQAGELGRAVADRLVLMRSTLQRDGSEYSPVRELPFAG